MGDSDLLYLAALLTIVGPPEDPETVSIFWALKGLLLPAHRVNRLGLALRLIPPQKEEILRLAAAVNAYARITGRSPATDKVRADQVVTALLEIPAPEGYIRHLHNAGLSHMGAMFHPNTLKRAKKELRGIFSGTGGKDGYWERTEAQLRIINE